MSDASACRVRKKSAAVKGGATTRAGGVIVGLVHGHAQPAFDVSSPLMLPLSRTPRAAACSPDRPDSGHASHARARAEADARVPGCEPARWPRKQGGERRQKRHKERFGFAAQAGGAGQAASTQHPASSTQQAASSTQHREKGNGVVIVVLCAVQ